MNPLKQFAVAPQISIGICNSEHPLAKHLVNLNARRIPGSDNKLYYVRFKTDKHVVTYRPADKTIGVHEMSFAEFKRLWDEKSLPYSEAIDVPESDKYIGNVIWRELRGELDGIEVPPPVEK